MFNPDSDRNWTPGTTALYGAVLGGIVGSVTGSMRSPSVMDLSGLDTRKKREAIETFLEAERER
jgi:gas vesicle protein